MRQAVDAFAVMCAYTIGSAGLASASRAAAGVLDTEEGLRQIRLSIESAPRPDYRNIVDGAADLARIPQSFPFEMGLELLIQGEFSRNDD